MCGIIAVISKKNDKNEHILMPLVEGLTALQHRGQDSCGIVTCSDNELYLKKEKEAVYKAFEVINEADLPGRMGIGHTRYATQGGGSILDSQPLLTKTHPKISIAHNGNITNYFKLKKEIIEDGMQIETSIDSEVILRLFAKEYDSHGDFFKAVETILNKVKGAYSVVGIIAGKGIFAFRDSLGIRPLVLGKFEDSYAFASETVSFQMMDFEFVRDIKPGEAVFIPFKGDIESKEITNKPHAHCMFEWIYFASPSSMIEGRSVYKSRLALGALLAEQLNSSKIDLVIPVPDSGRTAAIKLSEDTGIRYREGLIKERHIQRTFIMASQKMRERAVRKKLSPIMSILKDQNIAVVDDSIVRGTTSKRIVQTMKTAGVKNVTFISACPPIRYPCYYGIDMSHTKEFIATNRTIEQIRDYLTADDLIYANNEDIIKAIRRNVCMACLTGKYPEEVTKEEKEQLAGQRIESQLTLKNKE